MASAYVGSYYEARMPTDFAKRLTDAARRKLPDSAFCGVGRSYPVPDRNHALAAIAYAKKYRGSHKLSAEQADHILACVHAKYPELHIAREDADFEAKLTAAARKRLPAGAFCGKRRSFPVQDEAHAIAAVAYATKGMKDGSLTQEEGNHVLVCVHSRYPDLRITGGADFEARLSRFARDRLPSDEFCGISRTYPVPDMPHAIAALRFSKLAQLRRQITRTEAAHVRKCVFDHFPSLRPRYRSGKK